MINIPSKPIVEKSFDAEYIYMQLFYLIRPQIAYNGHALRRLKNRKEYSLGRHAVKVMKGEKTSK